MAQQLHHCELSFRLLPARAHSRGSAITAGSQSTPSQQTQLKPLGRSFTETPRGTKDRTQGWNSPSLGPKGFTEGDQTNSCKEIPAQAPEHEDQILICAQEASKPQLGAETASWELHPRMLLLLARLIPTHTTIQGCWSKGESSPAPELGAHTPHICIFPRHRPSRQRSFPGKECCFFFLCLPI